MRLEDRLIKQLREDLELPITLKIIVIWCPSYKCYHNDKKSNETYQFDGLMEQKSEYLYFITLNTDIKNSPQRLYETIAHEMRHVEQSFFQRWIEMTKKPNTFWWEGKRYYYSRFNYDDRPFEVDARNFADKWTKLNYPASKAKLNSF